MGGATSRGPNGREYTMAEVMQNAINPGPKDGPPTVPDITDQTLQRARLAARLRLMSTQGLGSTFLTGPLGDLTAPTTKVPKLDQGS